MALSERRPDTRLADLLGETGGQWDVVLDVPVGDDLIDAVLVGPRGLLAISAADTTSGATISGRSLYTDQETRSDLVRMTWVRAHRLATRLDHSVDAVLCLMNDRDLLGYVGTLAIVSPDRLADYLRMAQGTFSLSDMSLLRTRVQDLL